MGSNSSFYNQNATVYTDTNPPAPADAPLTNTPSQAPSSFFGSTGPILTSLAEAGFSLAIAIPGTVFQSNEWLFGYTFDFPGVFAVNFAGSQAKSGVPSTGLPVFSIRQNGLQVGTLTFNGSVGTFIGPQLNFATGDLLEIVAPSAIDPTLSHLAITLFGTRV